MHPSLLGKVFRTPGSPYGVVAELAKSLGSATIAAAMGEPYGRDKLIARGALHRIAGSGASAGRAVTVWNPGGNNTMLRFGIESCVPGDVIVVTTPADGYAQWGELAHEWAKARGVEAVIIDGSVRDVALVREIGVPLFARTIDPRQALKECAGYVNAPVQVGGVRICPGDLIVLDDDAILVLERGEVDAALAVAKQRADTEAMVRVQARTGNTPENLAKIFSVTVERVPRVWNE